MGALKPQDVVDDVQVPQRSRTGERDFQGVAVAVPVFKVGFTVLLLFLEGIGSLLPPISAYLRSCVCLVVCGPLTGGALLVPLSRGVKLVVRKGQLLVNARVH